MLDPSEAFEFFQAHFTTSAFRLEVLPYYAVDSDGDEYRRYLAGEDPEPGFKDGWLELLRQEQAAGKRRSRVRVLTPPLNDYLRYECEWGYAPNVEVGEEVSVLDLSEVEEPAALIAEEFWLLDDAHVLRMIYDDQGELAGGEIATDVAPYRAARDAALAAAEPFTSWWARHPDEWRTGRPMRQAA